MLTKQTTMNDYLTIDLRDIRCTQTVFQVHPFLKWAGGKGQLLAELDKLIPRRFNSYYEPFLGGGAMFFHLMSSGKMFSAYLSDINVELFTAYRAVKDNVNEVIRLLQNRLIVLNKTCFNGLYRVNGKGEFNVPPGKYKNPLICDSSNLENVSHALARATILTDDYRNVTQNAQKGDFIYLDQPYQVKLIIHDIQVL